MKNFWMVLLAMFTLACQNQNAETIAEKAETKPMACTKDIKICDDGQKVGRDINNQCEFFDCPPPLNQGECKNEMKQCKDGTFVYPNPDNQCAFDLCPEEKSAEDTVSQPVAKPCTKDLKICENGRSVGRDAYNNCEFFPCEPKKIEEPVMCTQDVKQCPDGSYVGRDSNKGCAFKLCPDGKPPGNPIE